jgi:proteic killer suppression protein
MIYLQSEIKDMIVKFKEKYLQELFEDGKTTDKKHRYQPGVVQKYRNCIGILLDAISIEKVALINALNYEILKGDKAGISSIRVNKKYRIEFIVKCNGLETQVTVCNILELSNHYNK